VRLGQLRIDSGFWNIGLTYIPLETQQYFDAASAVRSNIKMGVDFFMPAYNFEPLYRVTMLTKEDWTKATGAPPAVKGLVWFTDGSKMREGTAAEVYGQSVGRRIIFSLGRYATVFQAEIMASYHVTMRYNLRIDRRNT